MPRDVNGNFTLAPGNPVVPGTVIEAAWANPTLSDIASNITDSLSRTGQGGMLAPFRNTDGVVGAPGMTWTNEPSSGWYRAALNDFWYSVGNENIFRITKTSVELAPGKTFIGGGASSFTSLTIATGSIIVSTPAINVTQTWNNGATTFVGADMNITDTASQTASLLERWRVGGVERFSIGKLGGITITTASIIASYPALSITQTWNNAGAQFIGADLNITDTASLGTSILQRWQVGGVDRMSLRKDALLSVGLAIAVPPNGSIYLDGGSDTFIRETSANRMSFTAGGSEMLRLDQVTNTVAVMNSTGQFNSVNLWMGFLGNSAGTNPVGLSSGLAIGWNKTSGQGEVDFYGNSAGGTTGGFVFYDWNGATATEKTRIRSNGVRITNAGQLFLWFDKTSTGKIWRIQTDLNVTDDFGIYNETLSSSYMNFTQTGTIQCNKLLYMANNTVDSGRYTRLNQSVGPPSAGEGNIGGTAAEGLSLIGNGSAADVWLGNFGGSTAAYVPHASTGFTVIGTLSKGGGAFDIVHPLDANKRLRHSFIEGPRYDLIYRGNANVVAGTAVVNLDTGSGGTGMTAGTYVALTRNPSVWLNRGNCTFTLVGPTLTITGPDGPVSWMVIAERKDAFVMTDDAGWNDGNGNMTLEYTQSQELRDFHSGRVIARGLPAPDLHPTPPITI